jgi:hypothetical protein
LNRRRFLKYTGATAAVLGASAIGLDYALGPELGTIGSRVIGNKQEAVGDAPVNPNWDFSLGEAWWNPHSGGQLGSASWGYKIVPGQYGQVWLDNPDLTNCPNAAMPQDVTCNGKLLGDIDLSEWYLKGKHFTLETEVLVNEDVAHDSSGWSRVAVVVTMRRIDGGSYNVRGRMTTDLYTEYDVYRRNVSWDGYSDWRNEPTDVYEYHADQLSLGNWKPYKIDVTRLLQTGYGDIGGWGAEIYNTSRIQAWYLVVENTAARTEASWRRVKVCEE